MALVQALPSCSGTDSGPLDNEAFLRCWEAQPVGALRRIRFDAVMYPEAGVVSASRTCAKLRLTMRFGEQLPAGFDAVERARQNPFEPLGIRGTAVVSVEKRENAELLIVRVRQLVEGRVLSRPETQRLLREMEH
jgi:hypothetical protein